MSAEPSVDPLHGPAQALAEELAHLRARPELAARLARPAQAPRGALVRELVLALLASALFAALAVLGALLAASLCPPFGLLPLALFGIGLWAAGRQLARLLRAWRAPAEQALARVLAPPAEEPSSRRVHLALEDGRLLALEAPARLVRTLSVGDLGLASRRGEWLVDFERLG